MKQFEAQIRALRPQCSTASGREAAVGLLVDMGQQAVEELGSALRDQDRYLRRAVVVALSRLGGTRVVQLLNAALLAERNKYVRIAIIQALGQLREPSSLEPLARTLQSDTESEVRLRALDVLIWSGDPRAQQPLLAALRDPDIFVWSSAASGLSLFKDGALAPLLILLNDQIPSVRAAAAQALAAIGDPQAAEPLLAALNDENESVRLRVRHALGELREARAVEPLIASLGDGHEPVTVRALGRIGDPRAVEPLLALLKGRQVEISNWELLKAVAHALERINDPRAIDPLMQLLTGPDLLARVLEAVQALLRQHPASFTRKHLLQLVHLSEDLRIIYADGEYNHDEPSGASFKLQGLRDLAQQELEQRNRE